jgi:hypothetical protein
MDSELTNIANVYARNGTHSFKITANTSSEALDIYKKYMYEPTSTGYVNMISNDALKFNNVVLHGSDYGMSVYRYKNHFNICVVMKSHARQILVQLPDGSYGTKYQEYPIEYIW